MVKFSNKIGFDVKTFLEESLYLIQDGQASFVSYYTQGSEFPKDFFDLLDKLLSQTKTIYRKIAINREAFDNYIDFIIFDQIEDFVSMFNLINNYSRWLRSSIIKGRFKNTTEIDFVLRQNQTLEELSNEIGWTSREQGALDLALRNQIKETDYTVDGGLTFKFSYQNDNSFSLQTVVDEMTGENILGKDLQAKFEFKDDDLVALTPSQTFLQTCEILTGLIKNNNPEFPSDGFDKEAISNRNIMKVKLSTFIRQMYAVVSKDDTISSFSITDVVEEKDCLRVEMQYKSYLNEQIKQSVYGN